MHSMKFYLNGLLIDITYESVKKLTQRLMVNNSFRCKWYNILCKII